MALPFLCPNVLALAFSTLHVSAIYLRKFKPKIFTDITTPVKQSYSPNTGKISVMVTN